MTGTDIKDFRLFLIGVFLIAMVSLCYEIALSFEFAFMFWFYLSFIIIGLAMLGIGIGSVLGYFLKIRYKEFYLDILYYSCIGLGSSIIISLLAAGFLSRNLPISELSLTYFISIFITLGTAVVPFIFSGIILSLGLSYPVKDKRYLSYIYFADLVGAGIGVFLISALLPFSSVEEIMVFCGFLAIFTSFIFAEKIQKGHGAMLIMATIIFAGIFLNISLFTPEPMGGKYLSDAKANGAIVLDTHWTSLSRVDVIEYPDAGLRRFVENGEYPITISTGFAQEKNGNDPRWLMFYGKPKSMLAIGSGGGTELTMALASGVEDITAVEINPFIIDYMMDDMDEFSRGLYQNPKIQVILGDGRTFIQGSNNQYDLIENGVIGSAGLVVPSTAMLTTKDISVYTVEANQEYIRHLSENGVSVTIIYGLLDDFNAIVPEKGITSMLLKQYTTVKEALMREDMDPYKHFMMFRGIEKTSIIKNTEAQSEYTFIFKKELGEEDVNNLITEAEKYGLECLFAPYFEGSLNLEEVISNLPENKDVSPAFDDRPFFYYTDRSFDTAFLGIIAFMFVLTMLLIISPIAAYQKMDPSKQNLAMLLFFLCVGIGYILIEATLIQKLVLFLGRPSYAFQLVLFSMLVFSGIGSMTTGALLKKEVTVPNTLVVILLSITLLVFFYSWMVPEIIKEFIHLNLSTKVMLTVALMAPLAFIMGMPFPLGIRIVSGIRPDNVIWMYGVNSSGSVLASFIGMAVVLTHGMTVALYLGSLVYGTALLSIVFIRRQL